MNTGLLDQNRRMGAVHSPVIVIGMHRSGTSMLIRQLEAMGLFAGRTGDNHEAVFFFRIDEWLMSQSGASWENPAPIRYLLENDEIRRMTVDYMVSCYLRSPRAISFLGWKDYLRYRTPLNLPMRWGWKCPLATYTLPIWLDIFPGAKVIHIYRHGVDVANSLKERTLRGLEWAFGQKIYYRMRSLQWLRPKVGGFVRGLRCTTLEGGFSLWEEYLREARRHLRALGEQATEVCYEDLLLDPPATLNRLSSFCGLSAGDDILESVAARMKRERAYSYRARPELRNFAEKMAERLAAQGYLEDREADRCAVGLAGVAGEPQ